MTDEAARDMVTAHSHALFFSWVRDGLPLTDWTRSGNSQVMRHACDRDAILTLHRQTSRYSASALGDRWLLICSRLCLLLHH